MRMIYLVAHVLDVQRLSTKQLQAVDSADPGPIQCDDMRLEAIMLLSCIGWIEHSMRIQRGRAYESAGGGMLVFPISDGRFRAT